MCWSFTCKSLPSACWKPSGPPAHRPTAGLAEPHQISEVVSIIEHSQIFHEAVAHTEHTSSQTPLPLPCFISLCVCVCVGVGDFYFFINSRPKTLCLTEQDMSGGANRNFNPAAEKSLLGTKGGGGRSWGESAQKCDASANATLIKYI